MDKVVNNENDKRLISEYERNKLLAALHTRLFWVGEKLPEFIEINNERCKVHELIWEKINKEQLDIADKKDINNCIEKLKDKQALEADKLMENNITIEEANKISHEIGGILRAIMDLKEIENGISKERENKYHSDLSQERTKEIRKWLNFIKDTDQS